MLNHLPHCTEKVEIGGLGLPVQSVLPYQQAPGHWETLSQNRRGAVPEDERGSTLVSNLHICTHRGAHTRAQTLIYAKNTFRHLASIVSEELADSIHTSSASLPHCLADRKWLHSAARKTESFFKVIASAVTPAFPRRLKTVRSGAGGGGTKPISSTNSTHWLFIPLSAFIFSLYKWK